MVRRTGLTSWAQIHIPASAATGLMTLGKLFYSLVSVTSSCKMGVIARTLQGFSEGMLFLV